MRTSVRWLVPVVAAGAVVGTSYLSSAVAGSSPDVPTRTAEQVLALAAGSHVQTLSGSVTTDSALGLPQLPTSFGSDGGDPPAGRADPVDLQALATRFLTGKNELRVWADGPTKQRVQLLDQFSELDVVHAGTDVWTYSSRQRAVTHATLPQRTPPGTGTDRPTPPTPEQLASSLLKDVDPTTQVTLAAPRTVAGRSAYVLVVTPRTTGTLVDHAEIAVDAQNGAPLSVQVYARGQDKAAVTSGFGTVDFGTPDASVFRFSPPAGSTVTQQSLPAAGTRPGTPHTGTRSAGPKPVVVGSGWTAVTVLPAQQVPFDRSSGTPSGTKADTAAAGNLVDQLTTKVDGGRAVQTALLSVLLTDDGRTLVGAVPVSTLQQVAASPAAQTAR